MSSKKLCFFPYLGGKFNLLNVLLPLIPPHRIYVEVFGGAASLLIALYIKHKGLFRSIQDRIQGALESLLVCRAFSKNEVGS